MSRTRRFRVASLEFAQAGDVIALPEDEARHARVLRLTAGVALEVFDDTGRHGEARLTDVADALIELVAVHSSKIPVSSKVVLATAWPKGKRAAVLVEKCAELGVSRIIPVKYARSVVSKDEESEGLVRLRRIAAEAAKQSGRNDVPQIDAEVNLAELLDGLPGDGLALLLEPRAKHSLAEILWAQKQYLQQHVLTVLIGPEGGFTPEEITLCEQRGISTARLASHVLRVETAAITACATVAGVLI